MQKKVKKILTKAIHETSICFVENTDRENLAVIYLKQRANFVRKINSLSDLICVSQSLHPLSHM